jgi:pyruvate formate lyase activating enzyme
MTSVPNNITIKKALEMHGYHFSRFPHQERFFAPCETGGCHACAVLVNGEPQPCCHTAVASYQNIKTQLSEDIPPRRIVNWYMPHAVGGVGTPWMAKKKAKVRNSYIEVACFTAGCNLRCSTCQNFDVTYNSHAPAITPIEAAKNLTAIRKKTHVDRLAISGGEPTLNLRWLKEFFIELRRRNSDAKARLHLDTNASILTPDSIDALVDAGITDIGPDLKAARLQTYQKITGISNTELAKQYFETSWNAVKYIADTYYPNQVFLGVGLPFNPSFYDSPEEQEKELYEWAYRLISIDERIQVCILDYRPAFRNREISRPSVDKMKRIKTLLEEAGLKTVLAQTQLGHLPPKHQPVDRVPSV